MGDANSLFALSKTHLSASALSFHILGLASAVAQVANRLTASSYDVNSPRNRCL